MHTVPSSLKDESEVTDHGSDLQPVRAEHQPGGEDDKPARGGLTREAGFKARENIFNKIFIIVWKTTGKYGKLIYRIILSVVYAFLKCGN